VERHPQPASTRSWPVAPRDPAHLLEARLALKARVKLAPVPSAVINCAVHVVFPHLVDRSCGMQGLTSEFMDGTRTSHARPSRLLGTSQAAPASQ
jgi:hypothetical protein